MQRQVLCHGSRPRRHLASCLNATTAQQQQQQQLYLLAARVPQTMHARWQTTSASARGAVQIQARLAHTHAASASAGSSLSSSPSHSRSLPSAPSRNSQTSTAPARAIPARNSTLRTLQRFLQQRDDAGCAAYYEANFQPSRQHFLYDFCQGYAADARDALVLLMRVYTNRGRIDKVREVLSVGLRDLSADGNTCTADKTQNTLSPLRYAPLGSADRSADGGQGIAGGFSTSTTGREEAASLKLQEDLLRSPAGSGLASMKLADKTHLTAASSSSSPSSSISASQEKDYFTFQQPSLLNASVFNAYLEALTRRNKFAAPEVTFLLEQMRLMGVARDALTYHYLIELHVRAGYDPAGLWAELKSSEPPLRPLPATVQTLLLRVVPTSADPVFVVDVTKAALQCGTAVMDKRMLSEMIEQWLLGASRLPSSTSSPSTTRETSQDNNNNNTSVNSSGSVTANGASARQQSPFAGLGGSGSTAYPPEYILWLLLELELRCVLEKASFTQYVQRQYFTELLLRCAKCTDAGTAEQVLALMDRQGVPKTADVLALVIWCWSQAHEVEKTLDLIEWMALKGYLDQVDCFRKAYIDSLRYTMEQHYLMTFAESLRTPALIERALNHLQARRNKTQQQHGVNSTGSVGGLVTAHTLDLIVLSCAKAGEERRALQLVSTYESQWGVSPRTNTFNALLVGCARHRSSMLHRVVYRTMVHAGVAANAFTFRVLIRQAVVVGAVDEAIFYLEEVTKHPGLRVEVEMILPILERAARVGDVETANRISQFSLKCDIGIDGGVLRSVMQQLTEAGQSVEVLRGQLPLHEALRSRSKTGRQRARNEVLL